MKISPADGGETLLQEEQRLADDFEIGVGQSRERGGKASPHVGVGFLHEGFTFPGQPKGEAPAIDRIVFPEEKIAADQMLHQLGSRGKGKPEEVGGGREASAGMMFNEEEDTKLRERELSGLSIEEDGAGDGEDAGHKFEEHTRTTIYIHCSYERITGPFHGGSAVWSGGS